MWSSLGIGVETTRISSERHAFPQPHTLVLRGDMESRTATGTCSGTHSYAPKNSPSRSRFRACELVYILEAYSSTSILDCTSCSCALLRSSCSLGIACSSNSRRAWAASRLTVSSASSSCNGHRLRRIRQAAIDDASLSGPSIVPIKATMFGSGGNRVGGERKAAMAVDKTRKLE